MASKKIGLFWITRYYGRNGLASLDHTDENAKGFATALIGTGKTELGFEKYNTSAKDQDIEHPIPGGDASMAIGNDAAIAETVDMVYFAGHGDPETLYLHQVSAGSTAQDNNRASYWEMRLGDGGKLKWLVADACRVLNNSLDPEAYCSGGPNSSAFTVCNFRNWRSVFRGLRYILGFDTSCHDVIDRGSRFANYLIAGEYIHEAWRKACVETEHDANIRCAYLHPGRESDTIHNDRWNTPDPGVETSYAAKANSGAADLEVYPFTYVSSPCGTNPISCQS